MKKSVAALYLAALSLPAASSALAEDLVIPLPGDTTVEKPMPSIGAAPRRWRRFITTPATSVLFGWA